MADYYQLNTFTTPWVVSTRPNPVQTVVNSWPPVTNPVQTVVYPAPAVYLPMRTVPYPAPPVPFPAMEPFSHLYHNTSPDNKTAILGSNKLCGGTYFGCTLVNGNLPPSSPYGTERIVIPVDDVLKLFTNPTINLCNFYYSTTNILYMEYQLFEGAVPANGIVNVDLINDGYLHINNINIGVNNVITPIRMVVKYDKKVWVSLIVLKDIDITPYLDRWEKTRLQQGPRF